ncbi:MAG: hypothetical protein LC745_11580 [Planctomycetia bacterium]|nr:hypothetical protein [Planctomycetia bacterium]
MQPKPAGFCERGWQRKALADWDDRWHRLSVPARSALLLDVKAPPQGYAAGSPNAGTPADKFRPDVLKELTEAGFVRVEPAPNKSRPARVIAAADVADFRVRVRALHRIRLLDPDTPGDLLKFLNVACYPSRIAAFVSGVLRDAGLEMNLSEPAALTYLKSARWPDLVLKAIKDPVAAKVLDVVRNSARPVPIEDLPKRVKKTDPAAVRAGLDKLVSHLAVFEDLNGKTFAIEVGLLPEVRARMADAAARTDRPALVACRPG